MVFDIGPFRLYRVRDSETLDISLKCLDDYSLGWEYGWEDPLAQRKPWFEIRIGKLLIFSFQKFDEGFEVRLLGFWWIV